MSACSLASRKLDQLSRNQPPRLAPLPPSSLPPSPFPLPLDSLSRARARAPRLGPPLLNAVVLPTREPPHRLVNKEEIRWREVVTSALHRARDGTEGAAKSARRIRACGLIKGVDQRDETRFFEAAVRGSRPLLDPPPPPTCFRPPPRVPRRKPERSASRVRRPTPCLRAPAR